MASRFMGLYEGGRLGHGFLTQKPNPTIGRNCSCPRSTASRAEHQRVAFRADAAFARPAIYEALETRGVEYAIRIPAC
jgi:hypothetical protein